MVSSTDMPGDNQRAASLRSVASNSSIASGVSLTRRSRTRTRAKTLTGGSADGRADAEIIPSPSQLPYLDKPLVNEPIVDTHVPNRDSSVGMDLGVPPRPPRSPQRPEIGESVSVAGQASNAVLDDQPKDLVQNQESLPFDGSANSHGEDPMTIQHVLTANSPPSADTHESSVISTRASAPVNIRDSVVTHKSISSSSIYPPSTSTASGTESTSPRSMEDQDENYGGSSFEPELDEAQDFDGDDVSYRLRLLMKNNYFLPPAHSKPSASDFASNASKRPAAPTFLDLFRVGRSKPKPSTPSSPPESGAPILRTTSDSTTASGYVPSPQSRSLPTTPLSSRPIPTSRDRTGRVVVVREKMNDLVGAAKQAEQEMKTRSSRRDQGSQRGPVDVIDDFIDPTDAVDLPPPSAGYPFAVQASALHGLGVEDSVGAAVLAEHLPPPNSPGLSLLTPEEYAWRKALLHEAVGHSLQNSPAMSTTSPSPITSTSLDSSRSTDPGVPTRVVNTKRMLGQRIMAQPLIEQDEDSPTPSPQLRTVKGRRGLGSPDARDLPRPPSYLPSRAETPAAPPTPLAPPPRRQIINPLYSLSQTDLSRTPEPRASMSSPKGLRRAVSSPRLSDAYESEVRATMPMTPPLPDFKTSRTSSRSCLSSFETNRALASMATTTDSHYSEEDHGLPRNSTTLSIPTTNRPSLSEYSQPSPTASAFQDALDYSYYSSSPNPQRSGENTRASSRASNVSPAPRYSTMSPPPRVSSSLANIVLSPPPRSTSLPQKFLITRLSTSTRPSSSDAGHHPIQPTSAPEVHTTFPIPERRGLTIPLSLQIPNYNVPMTVRSAPPPASPIAFFDHIQTHPNAMDDLDSSSDEDENDGEHTPVSEHPRARSISNFTMSSPRPLIMRLGNHSTPHVARSYERGPSLPIGPTSPNRTYDSKRPVGNVPSRAPFFNDKKYSKSDQGHGPPVSAFDLYRFTQQHSATTESKSLRPPMSSLQGVRAWQTDQRVQESLRRLDGMLIQHMEEERNTIKRIATSARHTKT